MSTTVERHEEEKVKTEGASADTESAAKAESATAQSPYSSRLLAELGREVKSFRIRSIEINPPLVLSPMAGVTDVPFRALLKRRGGIGLTVSEFISV